MAIPPEFLPEADAFPAVLRALLDAELAAGNSIVTASVPGESGDGLTFAISASSVSPARSLMKPTSVTLRSRSLRN